MIITREEQPVIISPLEDLDTGSKPSMSLLKQGELVLRSNVTDEEILNLQLQNIKTSTTQEIRSTAAMLNQQKSIERFTSMLQETDNVEDVSIGLQMLAQKQQDNRVALEKEVIEAYQGAVSMSPVSQYIRENDSTALERIGVRAAKNLVIQNKIQELQGKGDWADTALNLLSEVSLLSFIQRSTGLGLTDYNDALREMQVEAEQATLEELPDVLAKHEKLIKSTQILGDNPDYVAQTMASVFDSREGQRTEFLLNLFDFLDTGLVVGDVVRAGRKLVPSPNVQSAVDTGVTDELAEDIVNNKGFIFDDPVEKEALASGIVPEKGAENYVSQAVRQKHEANQRILADTLKNLTAMGYDEVQAINTLDGIRKRLKAEFSNGSISDVRLLEDGQAEVTLFKSTGTPYVSERSAKTAITNKGINGIPFQLPSGGWGIKTTVPSLDVNIAEMSTRGITELTRMLRRPEAWVDDDLLVFGQISENAMNQITNAGKTVYDRTIGKLGRKDLSRLLPILDVQRQTGESLNRWFTDKEVGDMYRSLYGEKIPDKVLQGFKGYKLLNDFQYDLDNRVLYGKLKAQGFDSIDEEVFGVPLNAKMVSDFPEDNHIFFQDTLTALTKGELPEDFLTKYDLLEIDDFQGLAKRKGYEDLAQNPTRYMAVPKGSVELKPLEYKQLAYLAGGRIRYDESSVFLKQLNTGTYAKGGGKYRMPDRTLFVASSFPQARREANAMNALNAILRRGSDDATVRKEANAFLEKTPVLGVDNVVEYLAKVEARGLDINEDVVPLRNREIIEKKDVPDKILGDTAFSKLSNGRLDARSKERVPHVNPEGDKTLNPLAALNQNFAATAQNAAFSAYRDYTLSYLERFRPYLEVEPTSPRIALLDADIKRGSGLDSGMISRIKGEQTFAREVIGRRTEQEMAALRRNEEIVEWAIGKLPSRFLGGKNKDELIGQLSTKFKDDPIGKLRSITFNAKLGLFSLPTMIVQMAHAPLIAAIAPRHGTKALMVTPILRTALLAQDPKVIDEIAKRAEKLDLKGFGDLQMFFKEFRHHGFDNFGANQVYEDAARGDALIEGWGSKFLKKGRMFFEEGELVPRMTAYGTSVREWVSNMDNINPKGLPIDSVEGRKYIVQRTNTLTLGMTRADLQQGLKGGVAGLAFQFQSYPLRAIDAIFLPSKGLSPAERTRLALGYLVIAGSAGLPFVESFTDWTLNTFDKELENPDWVYKTLYNGVVDGLVMASTGEDTNFSSRVGLGAWVDEFYKSITDENKNFFEVLLGPSGSTTSGAMDTVIEYSKAWSAGYNPDPSRLGDQVVMDIAKQVAGFNNLYRAWVAFNTQKIYDSRGNQFIDISNQGAILQLFGLPPQAYEDIGELYRNKDRKAQIIKLNTEMLVKLHLEYAQTKDPAVIEQINAIGVYVDADGLTQEVNSRVASSLGQNATYKRLLTEQMTEKALGEKATLSPDIRARND